MTYQELVKMYFPDITDEECDFILWELTAFPFCSLDMLREQLLKLKTQNAGLRSETCKNKILGGF